MDDQMTRETRGENRCDMHTNVAEHLADFGMSTKAIRAYQHVVTHRPARPEAGKLPRIVNLAPESWTPRHVCALTMDKALREMEFPSRLAGAEWTVDG
jgi:hypothetical protein